MPTQSLHYTLVRLELSTINSSTTFPTFPPEFLFGVATAAYQIEGSVKTDGRGSSIWDTFSHTPGKVLNGDSGDIACDHYKRWESDLDLIQSLGVDAYRLSIAWPRLFPNGDLELNEKGLAFYDRLINGCVERDIKVHVTLYHWDLPQALADIGGWTNRFTAEHFAHFASVVARFLGDRIDAISTFNEPWCSSILSHLFGVHAPGGKDLNTTLAVVHGQNRAHGLAVQAIRKECPSLQVGIVLNNKAIRPASASESDKDAVSRHHLFHNGLFMDPLFKGEYPSEVMVELGAHMPENWQADLHTIFQPLDFWGLNYYTPEYVTDAIKDNAIYPATRNAFREDVPRTDIGWEIDASALSEMLINLYADYQLPPCFITENGAAFNQDVINGIIDDQSRIDYIQAHLLALQEALEKKIPLLGYFAWSLMDNFEWAEGYSMRFGLVHVDYSTQQRTMKNSAYWYRNLVKNHISKRC